MAERWPEVRQPSVVLDHRAVQHENALLRDIERLLKRTIPVLPTPAFVQAPDAPRPAQDRSADSHGGSQAHGARRPQSGQSHGARSGERRHWNNADSRQAHSRRQRSR